MLARGSHLSKNRSVSFFCRLLLRGFAKIGKYVFVCSTKHSLVYDMIIYYHYRTVYNMIARGMQIL